MNFVIKLGELKKYFFKLENETNLFPFALNVGEPCIESIYMLTEGYPAKFALSIIIFLQTDRFNKLLEICKYPILKLFQYI